MIKNDIIIYNKGSINMKFQVVSSGSKGNLTYIETKDTRILLDAGISPKEIGVRTNIDLTRIDAILITHEHIDHCAYLLSLAKKTNALVYVNKDSFENIKIKLKNSFAGIRCCFIEGNKKYKIKDLSFYTMILSHDCASCFGYLFVSDKESLAYVTDTGFISVPYVELLKNVNALIIEANHDVEMLMNSDRPWYLKERILSIRGHMSNVICGEVLNKIVCTKKVNKIILAHLSEECNDEKIAIDTVISSIEGDYIPDIFVANQKKSLPMLSVNGDLNEN